MSIQPGARIGHYDVVAPLGAGGMVGSEAGPRHGARPKSPVIGRTLVQYRVTAAVVSSGMGEVYRATDTKLGREVALKVLPAGMAAHADRLERFRREAPRTEMGIA